MTSMVLTPGFFLQSPGRRTMQRNWETIEFRRNRDVIRRRIEIEINSVIIVEPKPLKNQFEGVVSRNRGIHGATITDWPTDRICDARWRRHAFVMIFRKRGIGSVDGRNSILFFEFTSQNSLFPKSIASQRCKNIVFPFSFHANSGLSAVVATTYINSIRGWKIFILSLFFQLKLPAIESNVTSPYRWTGRVTNSCMRVIYNSYKIMIRACVQDSKGGLWTNLLKWVFNIDRSHRKGMLWDNYLK